MKLNHDLLVRHLEAVSMVVQEVVIKIVVAMAVVIMEEECNKVVEAAAVVNSTSPTFVSIYSTSISY